MSLLRAAAAVALVLHSVPLAALSAPAFTLDRILSAPFPSGLTRSPRGDAIAWVLYERGVRNIRIATAPRFEPVQITRFSADDGQEISEIAWNPDGSGVFFTRGGDPNNKGEIPNPGENPAGARQEIWFASQAAEPRRIGEGSGAAVAFDGSVVAWIQNGQIWSAATTAEAKAAPLLRARGSAETLVWSPRSRQLAFRSVRTDHSFIGVYDFDSKSLRFMAPDVDRDSEPAWSPTGTELAFLRLPASRYAFMHGAKRTGEPWSIRVANVQTGQAREIFRAAEGRGSVFWPMVSHSQLLWGASGRLVFPWERDGWLHLYSVPVAGGEPLPLTPGDYEIEHVALSPDGAGVTYSSNENDIDRRHLWQVAVNGGARQPLTHGEGIEWAPAPLLNGRVAMLRSDARLPARPALAERAAVRDLEPAPEGFPGAAMTAPQQVIFPAADGLPIHGQLFLPPAPAAATRPAIVFFHGGSRRQMLLGWHYMFYYHLTYALNQYFASQGYIVLSVNYRSGTGYGEEFREALNYGPTGASEYNDVIGAGIYLKTRKDVDAAHIGIWGGSYGGYLTALGLARASDLFAAGVDLHGVHDWNLEINNFVPVYEAERRLDVARTAFQSSPMAWLDGWRSPVLLIHGDDDRNVPFAETVQLSEELRKRKVRAEHLIFPDETHDFLIHAHWLAAYSAADAFFGTYLQGGGGTRAKAR